MTLPWSLAAVPLLIGMNAFFVAAEYAVVSLRAAQVEAMRQRGRRASAGAIARLKSNPASAIGTIQVCITMTNLLLGWIGEPAMSAVLLMLFDPLADLAPGILTAVSTVLSFLVVTLLTVVFSELLPKALTLQHAEKAAALTAVPILFIQRLVYPLVWLMNAMANMVTIPLGLGKVDELEKQHVTKEELRLLTTQAGEQGELTPPQRALVLNSLAIGRRRASEIMVPRVRVAFLDLQWSMDENRRVMNERLYTRLPLCDGGMDRVVGIVHTKEFLAAYYAEGDTKVLSLIARAPIFAPVSVPLERLMEIFRERHTQIVMLVDEYGGVEGLVTLQDVTDELVGEIYEAAANVQGSKAKAPLPSPQKENVIPGDLPLHELSRRIDLAGMPLAGSVTTVGGLLAARLGRIPEVGDEITVDGVQFRVVESDARAVRWIEIIPRSPPPDAPPQPPLGTTA